LPSNPRASVYNELPDFVGDLLQVVNAKFSQVGRRINVL